MRGQIADPLPLVVFRVPEGVPRQTHPAPPGQAGAGEALPQKPPLQEEGGLVGDVGPLPLLGALLPLRPLGSLLHQSPNLLGTSRARSSAPLPAPSPFLSPSSRERRKASGLSRVTRAERGGGVHLLELPLLNQPPDRGPRNPQGPLNILVGEEELALQGSWASPSRMPPCYEKEPGGTATPWNFQTHRLRNSGSLRAHLFAATLAFLPQPSGAPFPRLFPPRKGAFSVPDGAPPRSGPPSLTSPK